MYGFEDKSITEKDLKFCACGAHEGVYSMRDEDGRWYVCVECDLPVKCSYVRYETSSADSPDGDFSD